MYFVTLAVNYRQKEHFILLSDVFELVMIQITDISSHYKGHLFVGSAL